MKEEKVKQKLNNELSDLKFVLQSPEGRRFVWRVLEQGNLFHNTYVHGDQGYATTYNDGRRSVSLWTLNKVLEAKPEAFIQMQQEHKSVKKSDENIEKLEAKQIDLLSTSPSPKDG